MKKLSFLLSFLLFSWACFAQKDIKATNEFIINGLIETPLTISYQDLEKEKRIDLGNIKITNHLGEFRREYTNVKAVPLFPFLEKVKIIAPSPKVLSEYYFVFKASDGYTVVASWNEIFNTEIGKTFYLVVETEGKSLKNSNEKMLLIAIKDFKTGRRHIKGLQSIEIKRI